MIYRNSPFDAAKQRVINSLYAMVDLFGTDKTIKSKPKFAIAGSLEDFAVAVLEANHLLSALGFLYDDLYQANEEAEVINRPLENPIKRSREEYMVDADGTPHTRLRKKKVSKPSNG